MRNEHFRTWIMARNTENAKNEKCTLQDLDFEEKTSKFEKQEQHPVRPGIWQKEKRGKAKMHTVGPGIWREK